MEARGRAINRIHLAGQRQDVEQGVKQRVAHFLHQICRARIPHEGCAGMAADDGTGERGWNIHRAAASVSHVHALVKAAEHDQRWRFTDGGYNGFVIRLGSRATRHSKCAGKAHFLFQKMANAARVSLIRNNSKRSCSKEILRHRPPQIPQWLNGGVFLALDERLRVKTQQFAQRAQKLCRAVQPDRCLQIRPIQCFAQHATKLAVHADVHLSLGKARHIAQMRSQRKGHVHFRADAFNQTTNFSQIRRHVEGAIGRADDIDLGLCALFARPELWNDTPFGAVFCPQPIHCAVGALPLVFINGAR